jgi:hypothetical protein
MGQDNNPMNWLKRLDSDCQKLSDEKKVELTRIVLLYGIPLPQEEVDIFLGPNLNSKTEPERFLRYCEIERKVARAYSADGIFNKSPEQSKSFFNDFRKIMDGIYTKEEIDNLASYLAPGEESIVVMHLVG